MTTRPDDPTRDRVDRSAFPPGPWDAEPEDRLDWTHAGLPCLMLRTERGSWCGYAAVPPGHPLHGRDYGDPDVEVHGGLTYADACSGPICHVPAPGEPDNVWWFGFDCAHAMDLVPWFQARFPDLYDRDSVYRTRDYVRAETCALADQLAALA